MALILDKTITGTTIDESGATITNYTNLSYEIDSGIILENPYMIIDEVTINKYSKQVKITTLLFKDNDSRISGKMFISKKSYMVYPNDESYNKYFSMLNSKNTNIFESSYNYLKENILTNWKSDE